MKNISAVIGLVIALGAIIGLAALKPLVGVTSFAQTVQPVYLDANFAGQAATCKTVWQTNDAGVLAQAESCGAVIDAGEDAGGCSPDAADYDATPSAPADAGGCSMDATYGYDAAVVGSGSANQIVIDDGFNTLVCANLSTSVVYFGQSTVTPANGFPICTSVSSCAGSVMSIDTNQGEVYATAAVRVDGGYPIRCMAAH